MIEKIISGGQTGADIAGLEWAKSVGLQTGGWMPYGFRTEDGKHPEYAELYGVKATTSWEYRDRTIFNVQDADATILFGRMHSPGCRLTKTYINLHSKPYVVVEWPAEHSQLVIDTVDVGMFMKFYKVINIAGNREHKNRGINAKVKEILTAAYEVARQ